MGGAVEVPVTNNLRKVAVSLTASLLPVRAASAVPEGIGRRKHFWTKRSRRRRSRDALRVDASRQAVCMIARTMSYSGSATVAGEHRILDWTCKIG